MTAADAKSAGKVVVSDVSTPPDAQGVASLARPSECGAQPEHCHSKSNFDKSSLQQEGNQDGAGDSDSAYPSLAPPKEKTRRVKRTCSVFDCTSWARQGGVCVRHGAKYTKKICSHGRCSSHAERDGVCVRHGAKRRLCSHEGCASWAKKGGVCVRHGGR